MLTIHFIFNEIEHFNWSEHTHTDNKEVSDLINTCINQQVCIKWQVWTGKVLYTSLYRDALFLFHLYLPVAVYSVNGVGHWTDTCVIKIVFVDNELTCTCLFIKALYIHEI